MSQSLGAYVRGYIVGRLDIPLDRLGSFKFVASPGRVWSEQTEEGFDCQIEVTLTDGEVRSIWLNEASTCDLLNGWTQP